MSAADGSVSGRQKVVDHGPDAQRYNIVILGDGYRSADMAKYRADVQAFIDAHSFDLRAVKKSCVHIAQPDGKMIPFDTFNLFYRDERIAVLNELRRKVDAS